MVDQRPDLSQSSFGSGADIMLNKDIPDARNRRFSSSFFAAEGLGRRKTNLQEQLKKGEAESTPVHRPRAGIEQNKAHCHIFQRQPGFHPAWFWTIIPLIVCVCLCETHLR